MIGVACALGAFGAWGLFPVFFKLLATVPAPEILAHRVVWSAVVTAGLITVSRRWPRVSAILLSPRTLMVLAGSALIISVNWGVFIWAVTHGRVLESSLGYFINPLVSVLLGVLFLRERLRPLQWAAVGLAAIGVGWQVLGIGVVPWIALILAFTFGFYGLIRKLVSADAMTGLFVETALASPIALGYLGYLEWQGTASFGAAGGNVELLLVLSGAVTALPLILFVAGARLIQLSTLGLLQYIVPTGHLLLAVYAYGEPFTVDRLVTFSFIWVALAAFTFDAIRRHGRSGSPRTA